MGDNEVQIIQSNISDDCTIDQSTFANGGLWWLLWQAQRWLSFIDSEMKEEGNSTKESQCN